VRDTRRRETQPTGALFAPARGDDDDARARVIVGVVVIHGVRRGVVIAA
tara:strand:- start:5043 stop:5189 length:147 start_codon:yes stop_codon:yes gene_type:complete